MTKIIVAKQINKSFYSASEQVHVLKNISVTIHQGEFVSIMGPSGSGKSTLLYALSGLDTIDTGDVAFLGQSLTACNENELADIRRQRMGFVFQQPTFLKNLTLLDNILLPAMKDARKQVKTLTERAQQLMNQTGIGDLTLRMTSEVSGGQLQRAGICRALVNGPVIVFGDEPTGALNSKATQEIINLFKDIHNEGTTVLIVTHDTKVAAQSEHVLFMKDGQIFDELQFNKQVNETLERRIERVTDKMLTLEV